MSGKRGLVRGGAFGAGVGAFVAPLLYFGWLGGGGGGLEEVAFALLAGGLWGALFFGGLGLAAGAAFTGRRAETPDPVLKVRGVLPCAERGLGRLDALVAAAYGAALTGVLTVALLVAVDGPRRLVRLVEDLSPFGVLGPRQALLTAVGSLAIAVLVPLLAALAQRPRLHTLGRAHAVGVTAAGFVTGVVWPPLGFLGLFGP